MHLNNLNLIFGYQEQYKSAICAVQLFCCLLQLLRTFLVLTAFFLVTAVLLLILAAVLVLLLHLLVTVPLLTAQLLLTARVCWSTACRGDHFGGWKREIINWNTFFINHIKLIFKYTVWSIFTTLALQPRLFEEESILLN